MAAAASGTSAASRPTPAPATARSGVVPALASGLLGVLVGAGLVYGYETYGAGGEGVTDARVAAIEQRLEGLASREALGAVDRRIGSLEGTLRPLPDAVREARTAADAAGAKAAEALQRPAAAQAVAAAPVANLGDLPGRVTEVGKQLAGLQDEFNSKIAAGAETDATLDRRLGALDKALNGRLQANAEAEQGLGRRLEEQDRRLADLAKAVAERPDATVLRAGFRLAAANRIAVALATGAPYADAVAALRTLKVEDTTLAPLARFAETGAPTAGVLARAFEGEAQRIAAADRAARAHTASADGSFTDRLASMAESLVTIRRTGSATAEAAGSATGSVGADLERGDVAAAARAWDGLSEAARGETMAFGARLKARAQADAAARGIADTALAAVPGR